MSTGLEFDAAGARRVEKVYLTPDVVAQRGAVLEALALEAGERVLDIGSGPGLLVRDMAEAVGAEGRVRGVDLSADMLALSKARCAAQPWVEFEIADAAGLPYPDAAFAAGRNGVSEAEARAWAAELRALGETGDYFFSLNRYLFLAEKPGTP